MRNESNRSAFGARALKLYRGRSDIKARWLRAVTSLRALPGPTSQCQRQRPETLLTTSIKEHTRKVLEHLKLTFFIKHQFLN